jgi:hypothetical protein
VQKVLPKTFAWPRRVHRQSDQAAAAKLCRHIKRSL